MAELVLYQETYQEPKPIPKPLIELREEQKKTVKELYAAIKSGHTRVLVVAPCGYGKTVILSKVIHDAAIKRERRTLIVVPFTCLISQTLDTLAKFGVEAGVLAGGHKENRKLKIQIATCQTLARRDISWFNPEVVILDECHISAYSKYFQENFPNLLPDGRHGTGLEDIQEELEFLGINIEAHRWLDPSYFPTWETASQAFKNLALKLHPDHGGSKEEMQKLNSCWEIIRKQKHLFAQEKIPKDTRIVIGLTATPWRLSKKEGLGDIFETQVLAPTPKEMIDAGRLVGCSYYASKVKIDLTGVRTVGGDYNLDDLETKCLEAVQAIVADYKRLAKDRLFIAFAATIVHARTLLEEFENSGVPCAIITADTPEKERVEIFGKVKSGELRGIVNVYTCGIGFDLPEISCIVHSRPTKSLTLWVQTVGRGMRLATGKEDCLVLDQAGNTKKHGFIEDITYPELRGGSKEPPGEPPVKECPECGAMVRIHLTECPECGHEFEPGAKKEKKAATERLEPVVPKEQEKYFRSYRYNLRLAYQEGRKPEWARFKVVDLYKELKARNWWPRNEWKRYAVFGINFTATDIQNYREYLQKCCKDYNNNVYVERHLRNEFGEDYRDYLEEETNGADFKQ